MMSRWRVMFKSQWSNMLMAVIGTILIVSIFGQMQFHVEALQFNLSLQIFDHGITELVIPPVGKISAKTHATPLRFTIKLTNIDMELLRHLLNNSPAQQVLKGKLEKELLRILRIFILRILLLAAAGGMFGIFLLRRKKVATYIRGAITGIILMGILLLGSYGTYNTDSFLTPRYEGILKAAPWMVGLAEEALGKIDKLGEQMQTMANNLYDLFEKVDTLKPLGNNETGTLRLLHVSDMHNNPAGYDFVQQIVANFKIDAILDTGDLSDFGTPLEAKLVTRLENLHKPYIFVSGNHDSPDIVAALKSLKNVTVLDGTTFSLDGLTIFGAGDPAAVSASITPPNTLAVREYFERIKDKFTQIQPVDLLMIHNPGIARNFAGKVPVIVHGHDHKLKIGKIEGTDVIDAGTSGAAGIRGLQVNKEIPYSVVLLYFKKDMQRYALVAADTIKVFNLRSGFQLERTLFTDPNSAAQ